MMILFFKATGIVLIFLMLLVFLRALKGPTVIDRLLSVNVIGTKAIILIIVAGLIFERVEMFVDIAIGYGLLNYIASIAASKYFQHHKTLNPAHQIKEKGKQT